MHEIFALEDVLNVLIELETKGNENYSYMATQTNNIKLHEFFEILAKQELKHKAIYEEYKNEFVTYTLSDLTLEYKEYMEVLLKNSIRMLQKSIDLNDLLLCYDMAITLEKDTILLLIELKNLVPKSKHNDIEQLINEERQHLKFLYQNPL